LIKRKRLQITGRVQGVGFRPAVYRLACRLGLAGFVRNDTVGVTIELQGTEKNVEQFLSLLQTQPHSPPLAEIKSCRTTELPPANGEQSFRIQPSRSEGPPFSEVTPDIATCSQCLAELQDENNFRFRYPFINCTNCGPRYSIVKSIPYDRPNTTMSCFEMCSRCRSEYTDVSGRRFHAQPVACAACGPTIRLTDNKGRVLETHPDRVISQTARLLRAGNIAAVKGIGGFHLAVDATNDKAVRKLRRRKKRDHKPFAMMTSSLEQIKRCAFVDQLAEQMLTSPQSPIVLLPKKANRPIASSVAEGVNTFGFMLCYAPLHHLLFAENIEFLVMTSGNVSEEPLICQNEESLDRLGGIADVFLMHNREIYRQIDDSIIHFVDGQAALLRRARGYVPSPISIQNRFGREVFAAGGDLKNTFCFAKGDQLICSEHIGDLEDARTYRHYRQSVEHLGKLLQARPTVAVCDLHPGYLSSGFARSLPGVKLIQVQHHWAHIASVLAEHRHTGPAIGLGCDGTGYGTDGVVWGCECLIASFQSFERFGHLAYYQLAGGDIAAKEPIRPLLALLRKTYQDHFDLDKFGWLLDPIEPDRRRQAVILTQIDKGVNTVATSSLGRVFDAVAGAVGLGSYNHFEAQLPMALEAIAAAGLEEHYDIELSQNGSEPVKIELRKTIKQLVGDLHKQTAVGVISAKFHNTIAEALRKMALEARKQKKINTVALSGGVFCNRYLTNRLVRLLQKDDFQVLLNRDVPSNDGGLSLGQAAIAVFSQL